MFVTVVLVVEDSQFMALSLQGQLRSRWPGLRVSLVADAANATLAILGKEYFEYLPETDELADHKCTNPIGVVIWDNQFPRIWKGKAKEDMGIKAARALCASGKVSQMLKDRFIIHSGDPAVKFEREVVFTGKIFPKPMDLRRLEPLLLEWGMIAPIA